MNKNNICIIFKFILMDYFEYFFYYIYLKLYQKYKTFSLDKTTDITYTNIFFAFFSVDIIEKRYKYLNYYKQSIKLVIFSIKYFFMVLNYYNIIYII